MRIIKDEAIEKLFKEEVREFSFASTFKFENDEPETFLKVIAEEYKEAGIGFIGENGVTFLSELDDGEKFPDVDNMVIAGILDNEKFKNNDVFITIIKDLSIILVAVFPDNDGNYPDNIEDMLTDLLSCSEIVMHQVIAVEDFKKSLMNIKK